MRAPAQVSLSVPSPQAKLPGSLQGHPGPWPLCGRGPLGAQFPAVQGEKCEKRQLCVWSVILHHAGEG